MSASDLFKILSFQFTNKRVETEDSSDEKHVVKTLDTARGFQVDLDPKKATLATILTVAILGHVKVLEVLIALFNVLPNF